MALSHDPFVYHLELRGGRPRRTERDRLLSDWRKRFEHMRHLESRSTTIPARQVKQAMRLNQNARQAFETYIISHAGIGL